MTGIHTFQLQTSSRMSHTCYLEREFLLAIQNNDVAAAEKLFQMGVDVDTRFVLGAQPRPAICVAVERGNIEMVEWLIKRGCSINQYDASGRTPLHIVAARGSVALAIVLLRGRANVRAIVTTDGWTPLHFAVAHRSLEIVKLLLDAGSDINRRDQLGQTPLILACQEHDFTVVEQLISRGANVNIPDCKGDSPLMIALSTCYPNIQIVSKLLEAGAKVDHCNNNDETPLLLAITNVSPTKDTLGVFEMLVKYGCDVNRFPGPLSFPPLHLALLLQKFAVTELFIRAGCNTNQVDCYGISPLCYAGKLGDARTVALLVASGARVRPSILLKDEFRHLFGCSEQVRRWLFEKSVEFPTLQERCRIAVRTQFGREADARIQALTLPLPIKQFLCFEDLKNI